MSAPTRRRLQRHHRAGFLAGLFAGGVLTTVMFVLARTLNLFSLPELLGYRLIALMPLNLFSTIVETFRGDAKHFFLIGATIGQVVVCAFLGVLWASGAATVDGESRPGRRVPAFWNPTPMGGLFFALLLFVIVEVFFFPLVGSGAFGVQLPAGLGMTAGALALEAIIYGLTLAFLYRALMVPLAGVTPVRSGPALTRRQFLVRFGFGVAALVIGAGAIIGLKRTPAGTTGSNGGGRVGNNGLPPEITPNDDFYGVSKNFVDPKVEEAGWSLQIGGMVDKPYSLTLADIRALPFVTEARTLCCISNEVGGDLISNANWKGVHLKDLLERAGVKSGAVDLVIGARDGYTDSIPIDKALNGDVIAVYEMNGVPLPDKHGFPLRLLVPNIYGMKNVKWVTRLDVVATDYRGFWQEQGWSDIATIKTMSRIDFPRSNDLLPTGPTKLGGVAFAGGRGVTKIEVTPDGGATWQAGTIRRPLGPYTWVLWTASLDLTEGQHQIKVRATDGTGQTQTNQYSDPLPDGSSGWDTITVRAAPGVPQPSTHDDLGRDLPLAPPANNGLYTP
jgi:hypothetical protein